MRTFTPATLLAAGGGVGGQSAVEDVGAVEPDGGEVAAGLFGADPGLADQDEGGVEVGDEVEATGTVEERDVFTVDDYEALQAVADEETAQLYVDRGEELILVDATVTPTD